MTSPRPSPRWTLALTSLGLFMVTLDALVVATALPAIQHDVHAGIATLEWTVNAYALTYAAGIVTAAALGDRLGRRRVFIAGLGLFSAASAACALAPSPGLLLAARAVQGLGAAAVTPLSLTLLTAAFPPARRGAVVGIWGAIGGLAVAGGPVIGGAITQGIDWHWIFWLNVPIGIVAIALSRLRIVEARGTDTSLDLPGMALVSAAALALVWGLVRSGSSGWGSAEVMASLFAGVTFGALCAVWERRAPSPMLAPGLFRGRAFAAANATAFLMTAAIMAAAFMIAQYFQFVLGDSPLAAGLRLLPWTATPIVVAPVAGALSDRIGPRPLMVTGMLLQAVGLAGFAALATTHAAYASLAVALVVAGTGISMVLPTAPAAALGAVAPGDLGKASGATNTLQRLGGVFGVAVAAAVFSAHGRLGSPATFDAGFRPALAVAAGLSLAGAGAAVAVGRRAAPRRAAPVRAAPVRAARRRTGDGRSEAALPVAIHRSPVPPTGRRATQTLR
jgi:EmrB/QacA subfamily drug resistance transporter